MTAVPVTAPRLLAPSPPKPDLPLFAFLPGMDGTGELLQTQISDLERYFDIRCLSLPPGDRSDWPTLSAQTAALLRRVRQSERPIFLCGESFGGCLALAVALEVPQLCDCLILVNPASSFQERPHLKLATAVLPWMSDGIYRNLTRTILPLLMGNRAVAPRAREALLEAMKSVPPQTAGWRLSLLEDFQVPPQQLRRLSCPTLLVAGAADRLLPSVAEAERMAAALPDAQTAILPESGHVCLLETETHLSEILAARGLLPAAGDATRLPKAERMR